MSKDERPRRRLGRCAAEGSKSCVTMFPQASGGMLSHGVRFTPWGYYNRGSKAEAFASGSAAALPKAASPALQCSLRRRAACSRMASASRRGVIITYPPLQSYGKSGEQRPVRLRVRRRGRGVEKSGIRVRQVARDVADPFACAEPEQAGQHLERLVQQHEQVYDGNRRAKRCGGQAKAQR